MAVFIKRISTYNIPKSFLSFLSPPTLCTKPNPVVTVREGKLRGTTNNLLDGSNYYSFKGIPYAQPPVGKLRFKDPLPAKPWIGILDAIDNGPVCPQQRYFSPKTEGSENCLFLNVYTRSLLPDSKIPVMVYIHGGAYVSGSGNTDIRGPDFLLQHNIVLVTMNYRLEAFGFLCLDIPEVPGNAGLKDQVTALHWVKNNITKFGGDSDNITIFGDSAGGVSVMYHMISPRSAGLFHKAISQSGTILTDWTLQRNAKDRAFRVGKYLGKDIKDPHELLDFLQSVPFHKLIAITRKVQSESETKRGISVLFAPVVEKEFSSSDAFLTKDPLDLVLSGKIQKIPYMVGYTSSEGMLFVKDNFDLLEIWNKCPSYLVESQLVERISEEKLEEYGRRIKQFFFSDKEITPDDIEAISDLLSDKYFLYDLHRFVSFYAEISAPIYMYRWNLVTDLNFVKEFLGFKKYRGACHGDDVFYLFRSKMNCDKYEEQQKLRDYVYMFTKFWTDFAKTGNPTPDNRWNFKWTPYTKSNREYLRIDETLSMGKDDEKDRFDFWNKLFTEAGLPAIRK